MEQALMQQELSFEHKMANIHNTNSLLDHLQRKMNSYFNQGSLPDRINNREESDQVGTINSNLEADLSGQIMKKKVGGGSSLPLKPEFLQNQRKNYLDQPQEQLEFKLYDFSSHKAKPHTAQIYSQNHRNIIPESSSEPQQVGRQRQRLSQTTVYKASNQSRPPQSRNSNTFNKSKRNEEFRLIGKSKEHQREKSVNIEQPEERKQNTNVNNTNVRKNQPYDNSYLQLEERNDPDHRLKSQTSQNPENKFYTKSNNNLLHSMETIEIVMKQALDTKLRKIKQIQHQIMTENEERVYLYKINVRLNEQLQHLHQQENIQQVANSQNLQWTVKKLEQDIEKLKKEITKKKAQRTQLRKEEKTMKDGYQTVLNNKKNILRKDIEIYADRQNKSKQNTEVLRGLMKELDKLKGAVEAKIKTAQSKSTIQHSKRRKVVKSFKI